VKVCVLPVNGHYSRKIPITPTTFLGRIVSEIAFHEKAGRSQVEFFILWATLLLFARWPLTPCFHSHSRGAIGSLGAGWAFSFQPVLPPDFRPPFHLAMKVGLAIDAVTGTRL